MKKERGVNRKYTQDKLITIRLNKYDLRNILNWYRKIHHTAFGRLCLIDVKLCHKTKKKILNASKILGGPNRNK